MTTEATDPGTTGSEATFLEKDHVTWQALEVLVKRLAEQVGRQHEVMLAITRGGLVPAGMLAYLLGMRDILVAAVAFYDDKGQPADQPVFLQFPSDPLLHGKRVLIVDEVWDTGTTIEGGRRARSTRGRRTDDGRPPLQAAPVEGPLRSRSPRRLDRRVDRVPVQVRALIADPAGLVVRMIVGP